MPKLYQQKITFKAKPEEQQEVFAFDGGLVTDAHRSKLQPGQASDVANVIYNDTGSVKTRNGYLRYNGDPVGASSDEANTGTSTGTITLDAAGDYAAQTFQVGSGADVVQTDFYLEMANSGETQYVQAQLWSSSTGPVAELIDAQILLVSGTDETEYSFRFRLPYTLTASTEYAVVIKPIIVRTTVQSVNSVLVHRTGNDYANGAAYVSTDSGLNWSAVSNVDLKFNVYTGATPGTGLVRFYGTPGIEQTLAKFGSTYYRGNDTTGAMTAITMSNGITPAADNYIDYTVSNGTLLIVDDQNYIIKYRGSTNAAYTTGTISVTDGSSTVTGSGTSWATSTNAQVGEYIQLPDTKWYMISRIDSNTSLTIETTYGGSSASGQNYTISPWGMVNGRFKDTAGDSEAPSGLTRPTPKFIETHSGRVWALKGGSLLFSVLDTTGSGENLNDWDTINNAGELLIPFGKGDYGTGLYALNDVLFVFGRRSIWAVYGNSPGNYQLRNISNEVGMISKRTLVEWNDIVCFLSDEGLILFDGSNIQNISDGVVNVLINSWANKTSPVATLYQNKYLIAYTTGSSGTQNNAILFYDFTRGIFGVMEDVYASAFATWKGADDDGRLYFQSSNQGSIYRWDVGGHDDGYKITTRWRTPAFSFGAFMNDKTVKRFYLQQLALGDWNVSTTMFVDLETAGTTGAPINISGGSTSLWDVMLWDDDDWSGEGTLITSRVGEFASSAKYVEFLIEQTGYDEGIEILGLLTSARVRRLR